MSSSQTVANVRLFIYGVNGRPAYIFWCETLKGNDRSERMAMPCSQRVCVGGILYHQGLTLLNENGELGFIRFSK